MVDNKHSLAVGMVIAEIAERDGPDAAKKVAAGSPALLIAAARRVAAALATEAVRSGNAARSGVAHVKTAVDDEGAIQAFLAVVKAAGQTLVCAENVQILAGLSEQEFANDLTKAVDAETIADTAVDDALDAVPSDLMEAAVVAAFSLARSGS